MARGITSFLAYGKRHTPGGTMYRCLFCHYFVMRQRGNALAGHSKAVASIKRHVEERHPDLDSANTTPMGVIK